MILSPASLDKFRRCLSSYLIRSLLFHGCENAFFVFYKLSLNQKNYSCMQLILRIKWIEQIWWEFFPGGIISISLNTPTIKAVCTIPSNESNAIIDRATCDPGVKSPKPRFVIVTPINQTTSFFEISQTGLFVLFYLIFHTGSTIPFKSIDNISNSKYIEYVKAHEHWHWFLQEITLE